METNLLMARLLLAAVFATGGVVKLADRNGFGKTIIDFGFPAVLARPLGILLPLFELAIAIALVPTVCAWWGALSALALLVVFITAIGINLARGRKPDCRCFGQLHSEPVGWRTLARNAVLAAIAGFVVWQGADDPGPSAIAWVRYLTAWQAVAISMGAVAATVIAAQAWFLLQLFQQHGRLLLRMDALEAR